MNNLITFSFVFHCKKKYLSNMQGSYSYIAYLWRILNERHKTTTNNNKTTTYSEENPVQQGAYFWFA